MKKGLSVPSLFALTILVAGGLAAAFYVLNNPNTLSFPGKSSTSTTMGENIRPAPILAPPSISWTTKPEAMPGGAIKMGFKVDGSAMLQDIRMRITPAASVPGADKQTDVMDVPAYALPRKSVEWDGNMDLTGSLLAGMPVMLQLEAEDADKRVSRSEEVMLTLPERTFNNPLAKAIYSARKMLQDDPTKRLDALRALAVLLQGRDHFKDHDLTLLTLRSAAVRIALDKSDEGLRSALDLLWHAAIMFEENQVRLAVRYRN
jgi:hypothetical protein